MTRYRVFLMAVMLVTVVFMGRRTAFAQSPPDLAITWGNANDEKITGTAVAGNGDIYAVGSTYAGGNAGIILLRFDKTGTLIWSKSYDYGVYTSSGSLTVAPDGNLIISGYIETRFVDALLMKVDNDGNVIWANTWGSEAWDPGGTHVTDANGNTYQHIVSTGRSGAVDAVLLKYDAAGDLKWQRGWYREINNGGGTPIALDPSGNVLVSGFTGDWPDPGGQDIQVQKWDPDGNLLWDRVWVGSGTDHGTALATDNSGNVYVGGFTSGFGLGGDDCVIMKFSPSGSLGWQKAWGGAESDELLSMWIAPDGVIHAVGFTASFGGTSDLLLLRYDMDGNLLSQQVWAAGSSEQATTIQGSVGGRYMIGGAGPNCSGAWSDVAGTEGVPSGTILSNQGTLVVPVGTVMSVTPSIADYPGTLCTGGGGDDGLLLGFQVCFEPSACAFLASDVNCDGITDVIDVVMEVNWAFRGAPQPLPCCRFK